MGSKISSGAKESLSKKLLPEQIFYLHTVGPDNAAHIVHSGASVISYIAKTGIE